MKKFFLIFLSLLFFFFFLIYITPLINHKLINKTINKIDQITVYQKIYPLKEFKEISINNGKTALELLSNNSKIITKGSGKNAFITSINGRTADNVKREYWAFYINNKYAEVGAGSYILQNLDKVEWKIQTY